MVKLRIDAISSAWRSGSLQIINKSLDWEIRGSVLGFGLCLRHEHPNEALLEVAELCEYILVDLAAG